MKKSAVTLRSLEIAGFKSFAKRTKLEFGEGLVAIVGPNGSGKSNIVDAIKWVFGEQKTKSLRTEKSEELIYHGSDGKARASMAEVVLTLDNSSGKIPIELSEIEITRRLYRSGESNYLLNGKKVSLSSIHELLAKSGFGIGSYTVVGQGLIEKLILATGQERKQLFEEASGIKQFEIKQKQIKRKIEVTKNNLMQIGAMIDEYSPQHKNLAKQTELLEKRQQLTEALLELRTNYLSAEYLRASKQKTNLQDKIVSHEAGLADVARQISSLEKGRSPHRKRNSQDTVRRLSLSLKVAEKKREKLDAQITQIKVELEQSNLLLVNNADHIDDLNNQIKDIKTKLNLHHTTQSSIQKKIDKYDSKLKEIDRKIAVHTQLLDSATAKLDKTQKAEYLQHSLGLIDILQSAIETGKSKDRLTIIFYKLRRMIRHSIADNSAELALKVTRVQNDISALLGEREKVTEQQTSQVIALRANELDEASLKGNFDKVNAQLKNIQKQNQPKQTKYLESLNLRLNNLQSQKTLLLEEISNTNQEVAKIASAQEDTDQSSYYAQHEKLTNRQTLLEQQQVSMDEQLRDTESLVGELQKLEQRWFVDSTFKALAQPTRTDLNKIHSIEAELALLQDIDPTINTSYKELSAKLGYLTSQSKDLQKALTNLEAVLIDSQKEMQKQFKIGFNKINHHFGRSFGALFGGGQAGLELVDEHDGYGIEIMVQLPNKRTQHLSSLSGGEKALASVALLSAILSANPSPFMVLDEVDAALDEVNTKKFAKLLSEMTKYAQVLVVTHNHDTMEMADELLGVTTSGNNESHIIRVQLDSLPVAIGAS